ncbi:MAG TPA: 4'-phosphopantetheinyl transferase superfamily protein [Thermoanaerobaculia bacterium]|nr:4'-phosphopantetheinyl transferase superfamily protein [Thermoanaerobaculia bacterium]
MTRAGEEPRLAPGELRLWVVPLDPPAATVAALSRLLSADEEARAARFRFDQHRRRYAVGRGALRRLLGRELQIAPEAVRFRYGPRGKPFLAPPLDASGLEFNLSNSEELALVGFLYGRELGVDVEYLKSMPDALQISERFFSIGEREVLRGVEEAAREIAFFNCWTRKEAYLKAVGEGLAAPLDSFDVTLAPGEPPRMLRLRGDAAAASAWRYLHLEPAERYLGAVAIEGGDARSARIERISAYRLAS